MPSAYYDPVAAAKKYREVIRPKKGHRPNHQGCRPGMTPLTKDEKGALLILKRIDRHIFLVDSARIAMRSKYMPKRRGRRKGSPGTGRKALYSEPERAALRAHFKMPRRILSCAKCGNDRRKNPDKEGKCCQCLASYRKIKRHRKVARQRAEGTWAVTHRIYKQRRRALIAGAPGSGVSAADWRHVVALYGASCLKCGADEATMDHVVPLAQGGRHDPDNLQPLCHLCNSVKCAVFADYRPFPYSPAIQ